MFIYQEKLEPVEWKVKVSYPSNLSNSNSGEFTAKFKILEEEKIKELLSDDKNFIREVLIGWRDIAFEEGELEYSEENLERLIANRFIKVAIVKSYFEMFSEAEAKN